MAPKCPREGVPCAFASWIEDLVAGALAARWLPRKSLSGRPPMRARRARVVSAYFIAATAASSSALSLTV